MPEHGWTEGHVRESADGLSKREKADQAAAKQRLREAAEAEERDRTKQEPREER